MNEFRLGKMKNNNYRYRDCFKKNWKNQTGGRWRDEKQDAAIPVQRLLGVKLYKKAWKNHLKKGKGSKGENIYTKRSQISEKRRTDRIDSDTTYYPRPG